MEIMEIIQEAFIFPSKNLEKLAIYIVVLFVVGLLLGGGVAITSIGYSAGQVGYVALSAIFIILGIIAALIISGYQLGILKSGIDHAPEAPSFDWKNDFINGIKLLIVSIVYYIVPFIIVVIIALITNLPGQFMNIAQKAAVAPANVSAVANGTAATSVVISDSAAAAFTTSFAITSLVAIVLFIIFAFLLTMAESRLANTGSLGEALNIPEAFRDLGRIGYGKVIATVLLVIIIVAVISGILGYISSYVSILSILSIVVTPYLAFFSQRATGLLYSDIA